MNIWEVVKNLSEKKDREVKNDLINNYNKFIINRAFSLHWDTVLLSNELNRMADLPNEMQYDFLFHAVRPRRRFSKWPKRNDKDIEIVANYFNISFQKAKEAMMILSSEEIETVKKKMRSE